MNMKLALTATLIVISCGAGIAADTNEKAASTAALSWLSLIDKGQYKQSWDEAATYFKQNVKKQQWEAQVKGVRAPLGKVLRRTQKSCQYMTSLPGAPDGEYVVIQFDTSFEKKASAVETITPMKEKNGTWRTSGYFIK